MNRQMDGKINRRTEGWTDRWTTDGQKDEQTDRRMNGQMDEKINRPTEGWTDGQKDEQKDGWKD